MKQRKAFFVVWMLSLAMLCGASSGWAATYHVAKTGHNTNNTCAEAQNVATPKLTIAAGAACMSPGDTLLIRAGVYVETLWRSWRESLYQYPSGTSNANRTIIKGYGTERPIIRPSRNLDTNFRYSAIQIDNAQWVTFEQLEIDLANMPNSGGFGGSGSGTQNTTNITIRNNIIRNFNGLADTATRGGCMICSGSPGDAGWLVEDNILTGWNVRCPQPTPQNPDPACYTRLYHGIYPHGRDAIFRRNVINMNRNAGAGIHVFDQQGSGEITNVLIEGNRITGAGCAGILHGGRNGIIRNNELYDNGRACISATGQGAFSIRSSATGTVIYHNTVYSNAGTCANNSDTANLTVRNNLCVANTSATVEPTGTGTKTPNSFASSPTGVFVNAPTDLRLAADRNSTVSVGVTTDKNGFTRNTPPDYGAHEFGGSTPTEATTFYIKPAGNDALNGETEANAWLTFAHALSQLAPGHTLLVMPGTYTKATNGMPRLDCPAVTANGTATQPITVRSQTSRTAKLLSDGTVNPLNVRFCDYWVFDGLHVQNANNTAIESLNSGDVVFVRDSTHITLKNMLFAHNNQTADTTLKAGLHVELSTDTLIEDNELYDLSQDGIYIDGATATPQVRTTIRRNYLHSRAAAAQSGVGINISQTSDNVIENNIIEGFGTGIQQVNGVSIFNRYLGNVVLSSGKTAIGMRLASSSTSALTGISQMPQTSTINHLSVIGASNAGLQLTSTKGTTVRNTSLLNGTGAGLVVDIHADPAQRGDGAPSVSLDNVMIANNTGTGATFDTTQTMWDTNHLWLFGNGTAASPALSDSRYSNTHTVDPQLSSCLVAIPNTSPACQAGDAGDSIGAFIGTRTVDGTITTTLLWNASTHKFPCGTVVAGVNDVAGTSCQNVHERLNIESGGCSFTTPPVCQIAPPELTSVQRLWAPEALGLFMTPR